MLSGPPDAVKLSVSLQASTVYAELVAANAHVACNLDQQGCTGCARVVNRVGQNIKIKFLSCLNSQKQACRQLYVPSEQRKITSGRFGV